MTVAPRQPERLVRNSCPGAFAIQEWWYPPRTVFRRHQHETPSVFVVLSGHITERSGPLAAECGRGECGFIPAGAEHESVFGDGPGHALTITLAPAWLERCDIVPDSGGAAYSQPGSRPSTGLRLLKECASAAGAPLALEALVLELMDASSGAPMERQVRRPTARMPDWLHRVVDVRG